MKKASQDVFDQFFFNSIDLLCVADFNGIFLKLNSEWERTLGYSLTELEGKPYLEFVHPEDVMSTTQATEQLADNQAVRNFINRYRHKDGSYRWLEWRSVPSEGQIYATAHDITRRVEAELQLKSSEEKFLKAFMCSPDLVSIVDVNTWRYIEVNEIFLEKLGYQRHEIIGKTITEINLWVDLKQRDKLVDLLINNGQLRDFEAKHRTRSGEIRDYLVTGEIIEVFKEKSYLFFTRDITERKVTEKLIADERNTLRALIDNIPDIVYVKDTGSRFVIANKTLANILNTSVEYLLGKTDLDLFPSEMARQFYNDEQNIVQTGTPLINKEETIFDTQGKAIIIRSTKLPLRNETGAITGFVGSGHIITEQKQYEEALKKNEALLKGITQNIPGVVFQFYDDNGKHGFNYVSDYSMKYLGLDNKDLDKLYHNFIAGIDEEDRPKLITSIQDAVETFSTWKFEGKYKMPDGTEKYIRGVSQPRMLDNKLVFDGILLDITESWRAEQELANTRAILSTALMQTPVPMVIVSMPDYIIRIANDACKEILGIEELDDFLGKTLLELNQTWQDFDENGNAVQLLDMPLALALHGIETKSKEYYVKRKDGTVRWESISSSVVRNSAGELIAAFLVFPDITERKHAEIALRESEEKYRYLFMSNPQAMWIYDLKTLAFLEVNDAAVNSYGYSRDEFLKLTIKDIHPEEDISLLLDNVIHTTNKLNKAGVWRHKKKNGEIKFVEISSYLTNYEKHEARLVLATDVTDRKNAEDKIKKQTDLHQTILDTITVGLIYVKNRRIQWTNSAFCRIYGYEFAETFGAEVSILYAFRDDYVKIGVEAYPLFGKAGVLNEEVLGKKKSGTIFWINLTGKAVDPEKPSDGSIWMIQDITERKASEEIIRLSEQKFRSIFENSTVGIALIGLDGNYLMVNQALCQIMGYSSEELICLNFYQLTHPDDIDKSRSTLDNIVQKDKKVFNFSKRYIHKEGRIIWTEVSSRLIYDDKDNPLYFITHVNDISDRKTAEKQMRENEEKFRIAFENAPSGMSMIKPSGEYIALNPMLCKMFGYSKEELISGKINLNTHPDDIELSYKWIQKVISGDLSEPELEKRYIHKDGHLIWGLVRSQWIRNEDGTPRISVTHILDITERKKAEEEIRKLNRELEKKVEERTIKLNEAIKDLESFAYSVSHDLRAPIRHIDGFVKLMYSKIPNPTDSIVKYYTKIEAASQRMSLMIDSLLAFSRLGRRELSISDIDLKLLINEVIEQFKPDYAKRRIKWKISHLPHIQGDKNLLKLVVENIISNSIKYTSKQQNTIIEIGTGTETETQFEIYFKDNGTGFDMAYAGKLFTVFQRLHSSEDFEGIGIGLANVKQIIEKHQGSIRAEGKLNEGAVFYITLPKR